MPDVVIVGGGVIGAACALRARLARAPRSPSSSAITSRRMRRAATRACGCFPTTTCNVPMARASLEVYRRVAADAAARRPARRRPGRHGARRDERPRGAGRRGNRRPRGATRHRGRRHLRARRHPRPRARAHAQRRGRLARARRVPARSRERSRWRSRWRPPSAVPRSATTCTPAGSLVTATAVRGVVTDDGVIEADDHGRGGRTVVVAAARAGRRAPADRRGSRVARARRSAHEQHLLTHLVEAPGPPRASARRRSTRVAHRGRSSRGRADAARSVRCCTRIATDGRS